MVYELITHFFLDWVPLYGAIGYSGTLFVDNTGFKLKEIHLPCLPSASIKGMNYHDLNEYISIKGKRKQTNKPKRNSEMSEALSLEVEL